MNGRKTATVVAILLFVTGVIWFLMLQVNKIAEAQKELLKEARTSEAAARFDGEDLMIWFIGDPIPGLELLGDKMTVIAPEAVSSSNMPVRWSSVRSTEYDDNGRVMNEVIPRDYPDKMFVIVNTSYEFTPEQLEVLRNCAVDNDVPVFLIGEHAIDAFRRTLILVEKDYTEDSNMLFTSWNNAVDDPIDPEIVAGGGSEYAEAIMNLVYLVTDEATYSVVYDMPVNSLETEPTETTQPMVYVRSSEDGN